MEPVIISWTPTNWLTIFLMAVGGFVILKGIILGVKFVQTKKSGSTS